MTMNSSMASQLSEAATLLLVGMGFVFAFLTLMIGGIKAIEAFSTRYPGAQPASPDARPKRKPTGLAASANTPSQSKGIDAGTVAAITAAIHTHRQATQKQEKS